MVIVNEIEVLIKWYIHPDWYKCNKCGGKLEKVVDK